MRQYLIEIKYTMKKLVFLLFLAALNTSLFAQTKSYEEQKREQIKFDQNITTLYIELIGDTQFESGGVKFRLVVGNNKQFMVKDKRDFDTLDEISADIEAYSTIPDALDYLDQRGFNVEQFSTIVVNEFIRHTIILSKVSMY